MWQCKISYSHTFMRVCTIVFCRKFSFHTIYIQYVCMYFIYGKFSSRNKGHETETRNSKCLM